ncbi:MAG: HDOD domain-containing protein [Treponema sp.]|jgi:putative nucleotidyltransferase with HDIG domain|nr:HDOD domain-containing protein [Treponema sp.]
MSDELSRRVRDYIKDIPSLPTSVFKVLEICDNVQTSPADLNHVISLDPVLVGRVLKLLNSAYYGLNHQVTSLVRAIIMLGINTVKNLALSTAIIGNLPAGKESDGLDMEGFWRHSLCVGVAAKLLAEKRGIDFKQREEYFTAGLLHDIGKIPLNAVLKQEYMNAVNMADVERISLVRAEVRSLGIDHCAAGAMIADSWRLQGAVGDTITMHHSYAEYDGPCKDILFSVAAANRFAIAAEIGFAGDMYVEKPDPMIWEYLGLSHDILDEIEPAVNREIEKAKVFLMLQ